MGLTIGHGLGIPFSKPKLWSSYWASQPEVLFFGLYSEISGGRMPNKVIGATDYLTVSGSVGNETYQCPNTADYIDADTDYIWFRTDEAQRTTTTSELIGYDLQRTPVYYLDNSPNSIIAIMILKSGETITGTKRDKLFNDFHLSILWDNSWNDNGCIKSNKGFEQLLWTPELLYTQEDWYGIQINEASSSPDVTRIAGTDKMTLHASLPVQSLIKGCLLNDNGTVNYYLKADDWSKKTDGSASSLDGTDGMVMIEIPDFYYKVESNTPGAGQHQLKISLYPLTNFTEVPTHYISAYQAALNRSNSKLSSVINTTTTYRGGNNTAAWDAGANTLLGKPCASISRTNFRTYARNRGTGWNIYGYEDYKWNFWLYAIEYATLNSQKAVNGTLTAEGYKQGGLGNGVTTANGTEWSNFNTYNPFINCGASDSLANGSGEVAVTVTDFGGSGVNRTFNVSRYRGIENPFGHISQNLDGINLDVKSAGDGGTSKVYTALDPSVWTDGGYTGYTDRGDIPRAGGIVSKAILGATAEIFPSTVTGINPLTYYCDWYFTSVTTSSLRMVFIGGAGSESTNGGMLCTDTQRAPSYTGTYIGTRLRYQTP